MISNIFTVIGVLGLGNLINSVSGRNIFYTSCKDLDNVNDCIDEYGCGWCNTTIYNNFSTTHKNICREIDTCPTNTSDTKCIIEDKYYYSFNCFMYSFLTWVIIILALLCQVGCIFALAHSSGLFSDDNRKRKIGLFSLIFAVFITGMVLLFQDSYIFTNYFFVMFFILVFVVIINIYFKIRYRSMKNRYELVSNEYDTSYSINKR